MKEAKRFAKQHKVLTAAFALSGGYAFIRTIQAMKKPEGEFWPGVNGLGATTSTSTTTSSSHPMNRAPAGDMMKHPTALFGYRNMGSHCNAGVSGHCTNPGCNVHGLGAHCNAGVSGHCTNPGCNVHGLGAHCNAKMGGVCRNPHCHCAGHSMGSSYGNDTNKSPLSLMGTPNAIKRRTMRSNMENAEVYMSARESHMFSNQRREDPTAEDVMGDLGMVDTLGATGWM